MLERVLALLERATLLAARLLTGAIVVVLALQVFFRFVLNQSLIWSEEVATWCMIWVVFLGSAALMRRWEHVHIPIFVKLLPRRLQPPITLLGRVAVLACVVLLTVYGLRVFEGRFHIVSQSTGISTRWIKLSLPIGMGLMSLFAGSLVIRDVRAWLTGKPVDLDSDHLSVLPTGLPSDLPSAPPPEPR